MEEAIRNFPKQFAWEPVVENSDKWKALGKYVLCGMGGSHLQGDLFQNVYPGFDLSVHQDYGLPPWPDETLKQTLVIASSYSGNTEEAIQSFNDAMENGYPVCAISTGGCLLEMAKERAVPYIQIPDTGIQPRSALGFAFKALAKMVGREDVLREAVKVGETLEQAAPEAEQRGKRLAQTLLRKVPIVYASQKNYALAYNWKIKFNETAKIPAFYNAFPELNHNEMNGFDVAESTRGLCEKFHFVFLQDTTDLDRVRKRMDVLAQQLKRRGFGVEPVSLGEGSMLDKIFSSLLLADWAALHTAKLYGRDPEQVPMIEEFKKLIA